MTKQFSACAESQPAWLKHRASRHRQQPLEDRGTGMRTDKFRRITDKVGCAAPLTLLTIAFKSIIDTKMPTKSNLPTTVKKRPSTLMLAATSPASPLHPQSRSLPPPNRSFRNLRIPNGGPQTMTRQRNWRCVYRASMRIWKYRLVLQASIQWRKTVLQDQCRVIFQSNSCTEILLAPRSSLELLNYICTDSQRILFVKSRQHAAVLNRIK